MALTRFNPVPKPSKTQDGKQQILYVEDEDMNWEVTHLSLRDKFSLTRAASAEEAFALLGKKKFDLILMDIQLSGSALNGIEITQILKGLAAQAAPSFARNADCQGARIIFVTAYSARYTKDELLQAGGDDLITKPVDFTRLSLAISRLLVREAFDAQPQIKKKLEEKDLSERRKTLRVPIELNCKIELDGEFFPGVIWDLSLGGARISFPGGTVPESMMEGLLCGIEFTTAWGQIQADATVVRVLKEPHPEIGISFEEMKPNALSILEKWLGSHDNQKLN